LVDDNFRGKYTGISLSVEYSGKLVGPVMGGILADQFFIKAPFITSLFILTLLFIFLPRKKIKKVDIKREINLVEKIKEFLAYRELRGMAILGIVMHATYPALTIFLPLLIVENIGLSYSYVGYAFFFLGVTHILQFVFGKWSDKMAYKVVLAGTLISGIFMGLISITNIYYLLLLLLFFKGMGNSMWNISAWTLMSKIGEKSKIEGKIVGTYLSIAKIGSFLSFLVSGFIVQLYGINTLFLANGILIILGSLIAYPLIKNK
jgi:MFS family permease